MDMTELKDRVIAITKPSIVDIEMAERAILEELSSSDFADKQYVEGYSIMSRVMRKLHVEPWPVPTGFYDLRPDPNQIKAEIAIMEALQTLHATGSLIAFGSFMHQQLEEIRFSVRHAHGGGPIGEVYRPSMFQAYHLATPFRDGQRIRLASGDVYLSHLDQSRLPSRAKRCLRESIEAFKKGLYLSATIGVGAASESLWMSFGRLVVNKKLPGYPPLENVFKQSYPNVGNVLKITWDILRIECSNELRQIFLTKGEQDAFKDYADGVLELRNYALHNQDADEAEPRFTYDETGLLLLRAADYFNDLMRLQEAVDKKS